VFLIAAALALSAQTEPVETHLISSANQTEIIHDFSALLRDHYVLPDRANAYADALERALIEGEFSAPVAPASFVAHINATLQAVAPDRHLGLLAPERFSVIAADVGIENGPETGGEDADGHTRRAHHGDIGTGNTSDRRDREAAGAEALRQIAGVTRVSEISRDGLHQIGYIAFERLIGSDRSRQILTSILSTFTESDRLLLDLRECRGGDVDAVTHLSSALFAHPTHLVSTTVRDGDIEERWTESTSLGEALADTPVDILISERTFSACESLAFGLQATGRARLLGQNSGGGGHMNGFYALPLGFGASISVGRTFDPRTDEGWEIAGIVPEVPLPENHELYETTQLILAESHRLDDMSGDERSIYDTLQSFSEAWYSADDSTMSRLLAEDYSATLPDRAGHLDRSAFLDIVADGEGVLPQLYHNRMIRDVDARGDTATARLVLRETTNAVRLSRSPEGWQISEILSRRKSRG